MNQLSPLNSEFGKFTYLGLIVPDGYESFMLFDKYDDSLIFKLTDIEKVAPLVYCADAESGQRLIKDFDFINESLFSFDRDLCQSVVFAFHEMIVFLDRFEGLWVIIYDLKHRETISQFAPSDYRKNLLLRYSDLVNNSAKDEYLFKFRDFSGLNFLF